MKYEVNHYIASATATVYFTECLLAFGPRHLFYSYPSLYLSPALIQIFMVHKLEFTMEIIKTRVSKSVLQHMTLILVNCENFDYVYNGIVICCSALLARPQLRLLATQFYF